ncbi:MAG: LrgB family protein [Turicibacter sp.]
MYNVLNTPILGVVMTIIAFDMGLLIAKKTKISFLHPLLIAVAFIISLLLLFNISLEQYQLGGQVITYFLSPLTIILALPLYRQIHHIKKNFIPIMIGITVGLVVGTILTILLGHAFKMNESLILSIVPKSITTPMALSLTEMIGGNQSVTTIFVVLTGIFGAIISPIVYKYYPTSNAVAKGVGIGAAAHAVGTSKAMEMGETEGATSSASIGLTGILAIFLVPVILELLIGF